MIHMPYSNIPSITVMSSLNVQYDLISYNNLFLLLAILFIIHSLSCCRWLSLTVVCCISCAIMQFGCLLSCVLYLFSCLVFCHLCFLCGLSWWPVCYEQIGSRFLDYSDSVLVNSSWAGHVHVWVSLAGHMHNLTLTFQVSFGTNTKLLHHSTVLAMLRVWWCLVVVANLALSWICL